MTGATISYHLSVLKKADLVKEKLFSKSRKFSFEYKSKRGKLYKNKAYNRLELCNCRIFGNDYGIF